MKISTLSRLALIALLTAGTAPAQQDIPLLRPEEKQAVDRQADEFNAALTPILATAARSTVRVWSGNRRLAYGTVVGDGHEVLTKFSEVARAGGRLIVETGDRSTRVARVTGIYQQQDLAVLTLDRHSQPNCRGTLIPVGDSLKSDFFCSHHNEKISENFC